MDTLSRAAGVGANDVVLNTWMYHLVPAGLLFGEAAALETFQRVARIRLGGFDIVGSDVLREGAALLVYQ